MDEHLVKLLDDSDGAFYIDRAHSVDLSNRDRFTVRSEFDYHLCASLPNVNMCRPVLTRGDKHAHGEAVDTKNRRHVI
jgi:hypothetical protein